MDTNRRDMTVRIVPLGSADTGDSRVGGTPAERVALVVELSEMLWARTGNPLPIYTRSAMPVQVTTLGARRDRD